MIHEERERFENKENEKREIEHVYRSFPSFHLRTSRHTTTTTSAFAMQSSPTYPLTSNKPEQHHVDDDSHLSRIKSNDSGISYGDSDDNESLSSTEFYDFDSYSDSTITITEDGTKPAILSLQIIMCLRICLSSSTSSNHSWWWEEILLRKYCLGLAWWIRSIDHGYGSVIQYWLSSDALRCTFQMFSCNECIVFDDAIR